MSETSRKQPRRADLRTRAMHFAPPEPAPSLTNIILIKRRGDRPVVSWAHVRPPLVLSRILEGGGGLPAPGHRADFVTTNIERREEAWLPRPLYSGRGNTLPPKIDFPMQPFNDTPRVCSIRASTFDVPSFIFLLFFRGPPLPNPEHLPTTHRKHSIGIDVCCLSCATLSLKTSLVAARQPPIS